MSREIGPDGLLAEWEEHERLEAIKLYQQLQAAGETRDFPAVVLCALRVLASREDHARLARARELVSGWREQAGKWLVLSGESVTYDECADALSAVLEVDE